MHNAVYLRPRTKCGQVIGIDVLAGSLESIKISFGHSIYGQDKLRGSLIKV